MADHLAKRVNPRALVRVRAEAGVNRARLGVLHRTLAVSLAAVVGLAAFGTMVVRANDDMGVIAFLRGQQRMAPAPAPLVRPIQQVSPVSYFAPRGFFPTERHVVALRRNAYPAQRPVPLQVAQQFPGGRSGTMVASYAPFGGFLPADQLFDRAPRRSAKRSGIETGAVQITIPSFYPRGGTGHGRVAYCVRTCDGFFFPIGNSSGSDAADAAACNRLCPTAETKVYTGQIGRDIDEAQARDTGKRYVAMANAFSYRKSVSKSCACTANGYGVATMPSVLRDGSLRPGDIIMTRTGMKVFEGGAFPYREANFTSIGRSDRIDALTRESLRKVEQASLPGKSGIFAQPPSVRSNELRDLAAASRAAETPTTLVRYVGPDRSLVR